MKISKLLENPTPSSTSDINGGGYGGQAPQFGRHPDILEDEQIDETSAGATGSGSMAGGVPADLGMQRRSKGSIFQGVKTSKKFVNSPVTEDPLKDKSLDALSKAKDAIAQKRMADLEQWEKDFRQSMANKLRQKPVFEPTPVSQPGEKHSVLKSRMSQLDIAIKKQEIVDKLAEKLDKIGRLTPAMKSAIDTRMVARQGAKDSYQALNKKLDSALELLKNNLNSYKIARKKPKQMREGGILSGINSNNYYDSNIGLSSGSRDTTKQPYLQQWALKVNGKVDGSKIFRSERDAIQARLNMLIKSPTAKIGLVTRGGLAEESLNEVDPHNYDSDWDYQDAVSRSGKSRSSYRSQEDDTFDADVAYSRKMYQLGQQQKAARERDADHDRLATGTNEGFNGEYDDEAGMFKNDLQTIQRVSTHLEKAIQDNENLPEWCQAKIAQAKGMIVSVMDYMISQHENGERLTVDEGWMKNAIAGATLAGAALGAGNAQAADLSGYNTQYLQGVVSGTIARPMVSVENAKKELQARANGKTQQTYPNVTVSSHQGTNQPAHVVSSHRGSNQPANVITSRGPQRNEGVNDNPKVDLSPNYPNYATLVGEFIGMRRNRALFRIIAAELKPGVRETEKIFKARTTNTPISIELGKVKNRTVLEAELSEESLLAKQLARQLELFNKADDRELSDRPTDHEIIAREAAHVPSMVDRIENAITTKMATDHPEVIQQYGKQIVQDAIASIAVYHRHMRDITPANIDDMVNEIIQQLNRHLQMREDENK
jgi:hypothetical protein